MQPRKWGSSTYTDIKLCGGAYKNLWRIFGEIYNNLIYHFDSLISGRWENVLK